MTKPITLYAKYALSTSIVSPDTSDNALGNDITLEFSDRDWANAITSIKVMSSVIDPSTYKIDATYGTLTIDKSVFKKVGDFNITISAKEYANVSVVQKIVNGYNVHFEIPGEKAPFEVKDQIVSRRITEPVVYGYEIKWFADKDCTIPWDFTNSIYSAKTIYGKWKPAKYTVIYNTQDAGLVVSVKAEYNSLLDESKPTRTGYTFLGWYQDAEGKTPWNFATDKVSGDMILYAKWSINSYNVTFNSQGGSAVAAVKANYNTTIAKPTTVPTRAGFTFLGWYKDSAGKTPWNFAIDKVTSNTTIYAKWAVNPATPKAKAASSSYNSIKVSWYAISGVSGYEISRATSSTGKYTVIGNTTNTAYINTGLATGTTYYYKVRAFKIVDGVKVYSGYSTVVSAKPIPATPISVKAASSSYNSIKTSWASVSGASGYEVYRATSNTGAYSLVGTTTSTSFTNTGLATNKPYYYKVRAFRTVGGKKVYSNYSAVVYAKPVPAVPANFKAARLSSTKIKLTWSSVSGASGYELYRASSSTGEYNFIRRTPSLYYTNSGLTAGRTYYYKLRAYRTVGTTKVYSGWTTVIIAKP